MISWLDYIVPEERDETRYTPVQVYNRRVYWCSLLAAWVAVVIGYDSGFTSGMVSLKSFQTEFGLDKMDQLQRATTLESIISLFQAGAFCGTLLIYPVGQLYGRKKSFLLVTLLLLAGSSLQLFANRNNGLTPMYWGRFLSGVGIGAVSNLGPIYIVEVSVPSIRGQLIGFYEIAWQVGGVLGFWINYITSVTIADTRPAQWLIPCGLQLIPPLVFGLALPSMIESPRWLYSIHHREEALFNLCSLRDLDPEDDYIQYEVGVIDEEIHHKTHEIGNRLWDPFRYIWSSKSLQKRLLLSTSLFVMQNTLAVNAVNYYSPRIFQAMGISSLRSSLLSTGVFGVIKGICCLIWSMRIVDQYGRRPCLIVGLMVCSLCFWYIGFYIKLKDPLHSDGLGVSGILSLVMFYTWTVSYGLSWSGTPWVWNSEVFPSSIRTATSALNACSNWFWAYIMARFTEQMIDSMGYGIFFFFASAMLVVLPMFYLFYPETKGIPVEYMDDLFKYQPWQAHEIVHGMLKGSKDDDSGTESLLN
jgi:sugar porter (SP) family MFS transporter